MDFVLILNPQDASSLASLRLTPGLEVAEDGLQIWVRGKQPGEALEQALLCLPACGRYEWLKNNQLRRVEERIPSGTLPELSWQPLQTWLKVSSGQAAFAGDISQTVPLRLERSVSEQTPELLLTDLQEWARFAAQAAEVRLKPLQFAVNDAAEVLVLGKPLPPLPGRRFVLHGRVAVPAGFTWKPQVSVQALKHLFRLSESDLIVWHEEGTVERLQGEQFIPASRSAVQATAQACSNPA